MDCSGSAGTWMDTNEVDAASWVDGELGVQSLREILTAPFP